VGTERCKAHQPSAIDLFRSQTDRRSSLECGQLCANRTSHKVYKVAPSVSGNLTCLRIAHRLRDMQTLPYAVVTNQHLSHVYDLYYDAFERLRNITPVKSIEDNDAFCNAIRATLNDHLTVIPRLVSGVIEVQRFINRDFIDQVVNSMLRSRISRRVIAEQHLALTASFHNPQSRHHDSDSSDQVGNIFLKCNAKEVIEKCASVTKELMQVTYGPDIILPEVRISGHLDATFPYILSHLEYIIGELLRNSIQATIENRGNKDKSSPVEILIFETTEHVIMRFSDSGGGIPPNMLPEIWSFTKTQRRDTLLKNLNKVPRLAATMQELRGSSSLGSLAIRQPNLRLGIGLPMSKVYAEYWAGSLQLHNLEGYGVDAFLQISKLGNKNERITTRASMDAV
jgi:pyruvate dehydrogenase kinase 2/3/4